MNIYDIEGDSQEYEILANAANKSKSIEQLTLTCEIGVRAGAGSKTIIENSQESGFLNRIHIGIDPFGNILYNHGDYCKCPSCTSGWKNSPANYTNFLKQKMLKNLYGWCFDNSYEFLFFQMEDIEYFDKFQCGVPVYYHSSKISDDNYKNIIGRKKLLNDYSLVHIDGPHDYQSVLRESEFFSDRIVTGGYMVYDDIADYDHDKIESYLTLKNFSLCEKGVRKASYKKNDN